MKNKKGITLIALIITVIVLLILAGTAISIAINGGDIFGKASQARAEWNISVENENNEIINLLDVFTSTDLETMKPFISKEITGNSSEFVGYYADIDGNGTIDGIIYADLLFQAGKNDGIWNNDSGSTYSIPSTVTKENVKDYVISKENQVDSRFDSTPRGVIKLAGMQTGTKDRFYVMNLDDIKDNENNVIFSWYTKAIITSPYTQTMTDYETATSKSFGKGRDNTISIKAKCNLSSTDEGYYGAPQSRDIWQNVPQTPKINANDTEEYRWFVPSGGEWAAFGDAFNITRYNYEDFGLAWSYWASSQDSTGGAHCARFDYGIIGADRVDSRIYMRVSATF